MVLSTTSSWRHFAGQKDVQSTLHIPMVYESVPAVPVSWEYRTLSVDTEEALPDEEVLNKLGGEGWLLVGILDQRMSTPGKRAYYYFVRRKEA